MAKPSHSKDKPDIITGLLALLVGLIVLAMILLPNPNKHPGAPTCRAEDEVPVRVVEDSFEFEAGDLVCVHIDALRAAVTS